MFQDRPGVFAKDDGTDGHKSANKSREIGVGMLCKSAKITGRRVGSGITFFNGSKTEWTASIARLDFLVAGS